MFKVGDKVQYVREGPIGWEGRDWAKFVGLDLMGVYTVSIVNTRREFGEDYGIAIREDPLGSIHHPLHFILIQKKGEENS